MIKKLKPHPTQIYAGRACLFDKSIMSAVSPENHSHYQMGQFWTQKRYSEK